MKSGFKILTMVASALTMVVTTPIISHANESDTQIVNVGSRKCLEIDNSSTSNGARAQQWDCVGQAGSYWYQVQLGGGLFKYINSHSGKCLEVSNSGKNNGAPVQQWTCVANAPQQTWYLWNDGNNHRVVNYNSNLVLEISNSSKSNGALAQQWGYYPGTMGQEWGFVGRD